MREPLLLPLAAIVGGILASRALNLSIRDSGWPIVAFLMLAGISQWRQIAWLKITCLLLGVFFAGSLAEAWHRPGPPLVVEAGSREIVVLEGCVVEPPAFSRDREQFTFELAPGARARVTLPLSDTGEVANGDAGRGEENRRERFAGFDLHYGQRVEIEARIRTPRNFKNPGAFDYVQYLARRDIFWSATMSPRGPAPKVLQGTCGTRFLKWIYDWRQAALARIERLYPGDEYAVGMMQAILLGENSHLEKIWTESFRKTGTIHALVISGTHVAVLAMVLLFVLRWSGLPEVWALTLTSLATWLYAIVSGFSPPVVRAAGGFSLFLAARFLFRKGRVLNLLSAVAIAYLLWDPTELSDASFQLSFLAAAALGALALPLLDATTGPFLRGLKAIEKLELDPHLEPNVAQFRVETRLAAEAIALLLPLKSISTDFVAMCLAGLVRAVLHATELFFVSTVVQVGLALPMAEYFHRISFTGLTANLLIIPLLEFTVPCGFAAVFTGSKVIASLARWSLGWSARIADWHAHIEPAWRIADPPMWLSSSLVLTLFLSVTSFRYRRARLCTLALLTLLFGLLLWQPWPLELVPNSLELTAIDVGQGDSLLVVFPEGATMLVDGGGFLQYGRRQSGPRLDTGEDIIAPYLWSRGIRRLDIVAVTHAHEDHSGGMAAILEDFRPRQVWFGANPPESIQQKAKELSIPAVQQTERLPFAFAGAQIEVLAPAGGTSSGKPGNNDSLVLRLTYGKRSFLLTGDIERRIEENLRLQSRLSHADVLKVSHHGSKTSSSEGFLAAISPSIALISAGYDNAFGHPHPEVLERLKRHHAMVLRTDLDGLVTVRTDGERLFFGNALWENTSNPLGFAGAFAKGWRGILVH